MKKINIIFIILISFFSIYKLRIDVTNYNVIPLPKNIQSLSSNPFILNNETKIYYNNLTNIQLKRNALFLQEYIKTLTGFELEILNEDIKQDYNIIKLILDNNYYNIYNYNEKNTLNFEGYTLIIIKNSIEIIGSTPNGIFYGIQTLRKSFPTNTNNNTNTKYTFPAVKIIDSPRFKYRGMMEDICRHFFSLEFIKKYIDLLALHNMNIFHLHLSDDQGWRIEIKKYPLLTEIGSWRSCTVLGRNTGVYDETPYGGFYSQDEIKEIIAYAEERYITVIPEIDMPGHMLAALAAYPNLGCTGGPYNVSSLWGVFPDILCAGNDETFNFIEGVLDEIINLFPSKYIHIGGDEAPKDRWENCEKCKKRLKDLNLENFEDLQGYFSSRVEEYLNSKGRKIIGWDEITKGKIKKSATIMNWRGTDWGISAALNGHDVIVSPLSYAYFDYNQHNIEDFSTPFVFHSKLTLKSVYNFEPIPENLPEDAKNHIIGVQANLWAEYLITDNLAEYQLLPRMAAISEVQWLNSNQKSYGKFLIRLKKLTKLYNLYNYIYEDREWVNN